MKRDLPPPASVPASAAVASAAAAADAPAAARSAGLRYVDDGMPGIARKGGVKRFRYVDADGVPVRNAAILKRIDSLAIPPAWTDVWICTQERGHLQATGRDARGRKQYRYHPRWRAQRDEAKYERMLSFGQALPAIRRHVDAALRQHGLPREKVLATIVYLLEATMMRIGNEEYARENQSFGLTTLRDRHVRIDGSAVRFRFRGKSGVQHEVEVHDRRLARIIARASCRARSCSNMWTTTASRTRSARPTSTTICAPSPARITPPRISAPGQARCWRRPRCASSNTSTARRRPRKTSCARSRRSPKNSATRRPSAASAMCTRPSSKPIWKGRRCRPCRRVRD